jgi:hypothetical protein
MRNLSAMTPDEIDELYEREKKQAQREQEIIRERRLDAKTPIRGYAKELRFKREHDNKIRSSEPYSVATGMARKAATEASMGLLNLNKKNRIKNELFKKEHPTASKVAGITGSIAPMFSIAGGVGRMLTNAGTKGLIKRAAIEGASYGAIDKGAHNIGDKRPINQDIGSAAAGGAIGGSIGGIGAKAAQKIIPKILRSEGVRNVAKRVGLSGQTNKLSRIANSEGRREGFENFVKQIDKSSLKGRTKGTLLDTGSSHNTAFADSLAHGSTKARQVAWNRLGREAQANPGRAERILDQGLGKRSFERSAARSEGIADKAYNKAYETKGIKLPESLENRAIASRAAKGVESSFGNEVPRGTLKFHDYQKRALDKVAENRSVASHLRMEAGDAAKQLKTHLSEASPHYATALNQSKKAFKIRDAADVGEKYHKSSVGDLSERFKGSSAAEKHAFAQGAKKNIREKIYDSSKGSNVMSKLADSRTGGRLQAVVGNRRVERMTKAAQPYAHRFEALSHIKGGSKTAEHIANKGIFTTIGRGLRSPTRLGFRMADKGMAAIRNKLPDATAMRYMMNVNKLKKAMGLIKNKKHAKGIGTISAHMQKENS